MYNVQTDERFGALNGWQVNGCFPSLLQNMQIVCAVW